MVTCRDGQAVAREARKRKQEQFCRYRQKHRQHLALLKQYLFNP